MPSTIKMRFWGVCYVIACFHLWVLAQSFFYYRIGVPDPGELILWVLDNIPPSSAVGGVASKEREKQKWTLFLDKCEVGESGIISILHQSARVVLKN